jgi:hypothetical protein
MISIATTVTQTIGVPFLAVLWELPAAISYQINLLHWQHEGNVFLVDDREEIRRALGARD